MARPDQHRRAASQERRGDDLERFGASLHMLQDVGFTDAPGPHMRTDPGRPISRILSPTIGIVGMTVASGMTIAMIHLVQSSWSVGAKVGVGILVGLIGGFGIYMIIVAFYTEGLGHPTYRTERGEDSNSLRHTADQAPQDPARNTAEMLRIYDLMKEYARARYGDVRTDDAAAQTAITQAVGADSSCLISNFANERPLDANGVRVASYSKSLSTRRANRWTPSQMDVTLPRGMGEWRYQPGVQVCRPARP